MDFSEKLKQIRKNEGISQEQLAERIGVSRQAVTKWETGKGLPDIENMTILAEIFKVTLDELISGTVPKNEKSEMFTSETAYDIDTDTHFDINIGNMRDITVSGGEDEKLHIILSSETAEDIGSVFKVKLDGHKNKLDVECTRKDKMSRYEAQENVSVKIVLPKQLTDHCEISAQTNLLCISSLDIRRIEYDGSADSVVIDNSTGSIELTSKSDMDITADKINGVLDINLWRARATVHISEENIPAVENNGRKCSIAYIKDGKPYEPDTAEKSGVIKAAGIGTDVVVEIK